MLGFRKHTILIFLLLVIPVWGIAQAKGLNNLTIVVEFKEVPSNNVSILHTPLRYDKDFALSFTMDDGTKDTYTHAFKFLSGGVVESTDYDPLFYTDGCGNDINFSMSSAIYSMSVDESIEIHDPNISDPSVYITWPEIIEMYRGGWGIFNHGLTTATSGDLDYLVARNHSQIKSNTADSIEGGIHPTVFVNPNGTAAFNTPVFNQDYNAAYRSIVYGVDYLNVYDPSTILNLHQLEIGRQELNQTNSIADLADDLYTASASSTTAPWSSTFSHSVTGKYSGYTFSMFKTYMEYIESTYGKSGLDNIWFTSEEEVLDYILVRDAVTINQNVAGNNLLISFSGASVPEDLRTYAISLALSTTATDTITGITVDGHTVASYNGIGDDKALINIAWDGFNAPTNLEMANYYVDSAESVRTQNVANIAMDYVNTLEFGSVKQGLKDRLCAITEVSLPPAFCATCSTSIGNDTTICIDDCIDLSVDTETSYLWSTGETTSTINVCPTSTTQYSVQVFDALNCEARDTILITVAPKPAIQISNDTVICPGSEVKLWVNGGTEYSWSTGETTDTIYVNPSVDTKYYVTVKNSFGCESIDSVQVDMHPVPVADAGMNQSILLGESATLTASGGDSYVWKTGATTASIVVTPTDPTWYSVVAFNTHGCNDVDSVLVTQRIPHENGAGAVEVQSIVVLFETNPSSVNVQATPLKYNKDFALSLHVKNGDKDVYTHAFPFLNGGTVEGVNYPGLTFTDGCDNEVNFKMGTSIYSFADNGISDVHDPDSDYTEDFAIWEELISLYNAGWGIFNQGLIPDDSEEEYYTVGRNHSFVKFKTYESVEGGIPMTTFMNPEGNTVFSSAAFNQDYRAAFANYAAGVQYYDIGTIPNADSLKMGINSLDNQQSLAALADLMHNNYDPNKRLWASANLSSLTDGSNLGYAFSVFRFYLDYIEDKYGTDGLDNIWFTHEEEVWDYITVYESINVHEELLDDRLLITFSGNLPTNLNSYALSLTLKSDANISSVEINGGSGNTYKVIADTSALFNLNWDSRIIIADSILAENYVSLAEAYRTTEDALIAMDYVNMLAFGPKKEELRTRLCAISEATLPLGYCDCSFNIGADTLICKDDCIELTAPDGSSYLWSTGETEQTIEVCPPDTTKYWVTVFNQYDCYFTDTLIVNVNRDDFAYAGLDTTICELDSVELIATGGVSFLWNTGDTTNTIKVSPDVNTTYYVDVTNAIGCVSRDTVQVDLYALPAPEIISNQNICIGDSVELWVNGGSRYYWNTTDTNDTIKVSPSDTTKYYVWVYNENDCQVLDSVTVNVIQLPVADAGSDIDICFGDCTTLTATGGDTFDWSTGDEDAEIEVCPDDTTMYYVTVYNEHGCFREDSVKVMVNEVPVSETINDTIVCPNQCIKIWAAGGESYLWSTGETTDTIEVCPSEETKYYVEVFNAFSCSTLDSVFVDTYYPTTATAGEDVTICPGECADLAAFGGYLYDWSTGDETNAITICPDTDTEYYVTVYSEYNCPDTDTVAVFLRTPPVISAGNDTTKCVSDCIELKATGGIDYIWNNGGEERITEVCPSTQTKYYVTGYDEFGCWSTDTVEVFINAYPDVTLGGLLPVYCDDASAVILEGSPANGAFGGEGVSGNVFSPTAASLGNHQIHYTIIDNDGCAVGDTVEVNINETPVFDLGEDVILCTDETMEIFVPTGYDQYLWSNGNTSGSFLLVEYGVFDFGTTVIELIATDNGCVARDQISITYESCNVGIDDLEDIGINIYPNPSYGMINLSYDGSEPVQYLSIANLQGQIVYTEKLDACNDEECHQTLDLSFLEKGTYFIRFFNKKTSRNGKLIIQ